jgi:hypothetical protein
MDSDMNAVEGAGGLGVLQGSLKQKAWCSGRELCELSVKSAAIILP